MIVRFIWQKLSSVERDVTLIGRNFWQLFSQKCDETLELASRISVHNQEVTSHEEDIMATHLMGKCKGKEREKSSLSLFLERIRA